MKRKMVGFSVLLLVFCLNFICIFSVANASSIRDKVKKYKKQGYKCTEIYDEGGKNESFAAFRATRKGVIKKVCMGQGQSEATATANIAYIPSGWTRFSYNIVTAFVRTSITEYHLFEPGYWESSMAFTLSQASEVEVKGRLRNDSKEILTGYVHDVD